MGHWRKLVVDGERYRWAGSKYIIVQDAHGLRVLFATAPEVKGIDWNAWERGQWKGTPDGMIRPGEVARLIRLARKKKKPAKTD